MQKYTYTAILHVFYAEFRLSSFSLTFPFRFMVTLYDTLAPISR